MSSANYAVVRYVGDPGRNEALNVGILLWSEMGYRLRIDDEAVGRVIRDNPHLARDALMFLDASLALRLAEIQDAPERAIPSFLAAQGGFPVAFSESRFTTVADEGDGGLDETLDRLVTRIVRPKRRSAGFSVSPVGAVERGLSPLIKSHLIHRAHAFPASRTGVPRVADFFANSTANLALDALNLSLTRADEIRRRADAEAFKVSDVRDMNDIRYVVYCSLSQDEKLFGTNEEAKRVLGSVGAEVVSEADEAIREMQLAATGRAL